MSQRILIVEDEPKLAALLSDYLGQAGFATESIGDGTQVTGRIKSGPFDLVLLDLMLPGRDGLEVCKELRAFSSIPIIIVTAKVEEIDRLLGLELGADDYICKPYSPREVVARVKTVLRRNGAGTSTALQLDLQGYRALWQGRDLELTAVEFKLLALLASRPGRIFSRQQLMDQIYTDQRVVCDRTIDSHIKKVRRKLQAVSPETELIHSLYGVGYKYELM